MGLTRRQRQALAALGEQLAREDPELAAQLSRPARRLDFSNTTWSDPDRRADRSVLLVLGLGMVAYGVVLSVQTATTIGAVALLMCWIPGGTGRG